MSSLAVPPFGSWHERSRVPSPLQQWRGNINYHFVRFNSVCKNTQGKKKNTPLEKPISDEVVAAFAS